jgi:hypothetical protein
VSREQLQRWVAGYERAWRSAGTDTLGALFAARASYRTAPFEEPHRGLDAIAAFWEAERQGPDEVFTLEWEIVAVEGRTGVVRCEVRYGEPQPRTYRDLWVVELDEQGRCVAFEEWPFWPPGQEGEFASGPER